MTWQDSTTAQEAELDRIRAEYARREREFARDHYGWNRPANLFLHCQTVRRCIDALVGEGMFPLDERIVLDLGCGRGQWLAEFLQWGADSANLRGIDLATDRIRAARKRLPSADLRSGDACRLPWPDGSIDLATQFTLFTSVLDGPMKHNIASEMLRVLKPDGLILWYDFRCNNPQNENVRGIAAREIESLFPECAITLRSVTLAPPLARLVVPASWPAALALEHVPFLRTHYLGVIRKPPLTNVTCLISQS